MIPVNPPTSIDIDISGENINPPPQKESQLPQAMTLLFQGKNKNPQRKSTPTSNVVGKFWRKPYKEKGGERERESWWSIPQSER